MYRSSQLRPEKVGVVVTLCGRDLQEVSNAFLARTLFVPKNTIAAKRQRTIFNKCNTEMWYCAWWETDLSAFHHEHPHNTFSGHVRLACRRDITLRTIGSHHEPAMKIRGGLCANLLRKRESARHMRRKHIPRDTFSHLKYRRMCTSSPKQR